MKKLIFLSFLGLFFLAGCGNTPDNVTINSLVSTDPEINIRVGTGYDIENIYDIDFYSTGYIYTYTYQDLGIKITTPANYEPYFSKKTETPIFKRYKNIIYNAHGPIWGDHIEILYKDPNTTLKQIVIENQLPKGCAIVTGVFDTSNAFFPSMLGFHVVYIQTMDYDAYGDKTCHPNKEFPQSDGPIAFVMDPKHPEKYYKIGNTDGCAPGPCTIFGNIEFF